MKKYKPRFEWDYVGNSFDGESFEIEGIDVWEYTWKQTSEPKAQIKDPSYNQDFSFPVYKIETENKKIKFAAGEFSNCVWGFYLLKDNLK
jgi:hypothetical protein